MPPRVVTFGEIMLRLSPPAHQRFIQASQFDVNLGGSEANVAVSLACFGASARFVSRLPENEIGDLAANSIAQFGVDTSCIVRGGNRVGVYYLENGAGCRASKVIYDRGDSAVCGLSPEELDFDAVFDAVDWFHWSGITPALGEGPRKTLEHLLHSARSRDIRISADLNYRAKLWSPSDAQSCLKPLMEHVDVCIANEEDAEKCLGLFPAGTQVERAELDRDAYEDLARRMKSTYGFSTVAITLRESHSASRNSWSALILDGEMAAPAFSRRYDIDMVDRVGAGDAFAAGLIFKLSGRADARAAVEYAVAASALKHTIQGDFNPVSVDEVEKLMDSTGSGRVER